MAFNLIKVYFERFRSLWHKVHRPGLAVFLALRLDQSGGVLESVPTLNQQDSQLCYAFSAAQLFDAVRIAKNINPPGYRYTSPYYVGLASFFHPLTISSFQSLSSSGGSTRLDYGWAWRAYAETVKMGLCEGSALHGQEGVGDLSAYWSAYEAVLDLAISYSQDRDNFVKQAQAIFENEFTAKKVRAELLPGESLYFYILEQTQNIVGKIKQGFSSSIIEKEKSKLDREALKIFLESGCQKKSTEEMVSLSDMPKVRIKEGIDVQGIEEWITKSLTGNNSLKRGLPVIIDFCSHSLTEPNGSFSYDSSAFVDNCGFHSVLLIGQRKGSENQIEYLIRDYQHPSIGCRPLDDSFSCEPSSGQYWAPGPVILRNIQYMSFIP